MIELKINGQIYAGWKTASVLRGLNCIASSFDLTVSDRFIGSKNNIPLDAPCQIISDGIPVITGYLDEISPTYTSSKHEVTFSGRSKTCDLVDCSAIIDNGQIIGGTPQEIIRSVIKPFDINLIFSSSKPILSIPDFQVEPGETAQSIIDKVCKQTGLIYTDDGYGNLVIQSIGKGLSVGKLIHKAESNKNNVLSGRGAYSTRDRFRDYYVKSQMAGTDELGSEDITIVEGHAIDNDVLRYRPLILTGETAMDNGVAQTRAEWERSNRQGKSKSFEYVVSGWQNANGSIWSPNSYIELEDDFIHISGQLIISAVKFLTGNKTTTNLQISPPEAYMLSSMNQAVKTYQCWKELKDGV
jgi:prophage tail gpP-like protein